MKVNPLQHAHIDNIQFTVKDIRDKLLPVLKSQYIPGTSGKDIEVWANHLVDECKTAFSALLPFQEHEIEFLERLQKTGLVLPELISNDLDFCERVKLHPALLWRAQQAMHSS